MSNQRNRNIDNCVIECEKYGFDKQTCFDECQTDPESLRKKLQKQNSKDMDTSLNVQNKMSSSRKLNQKQSQQQRQQKQQTNTISSSRFHQALPLDVIFTEYENQNVTQKNGRKPNNEYGTKTSTNIRAMNPLTTTTSKLTNSITTKNNPEEKLSTKDTMNPITTKAFIATDSTTRAWDTTKNNSKKNLPKKDTVNLDNATTMAAPTANNTINTTDSINKQLNKSDEQMNMETLTNNQATIKYINSNDAQTVYNSNSNVKLNFNDENNACKRQLDTNLNCSYNQENTPSKQIEKLYIIYNRIGSSNVLLPNELKKFINKFFLKSNEKVYLLDIANNSNDVKKLKSLKTSDYVFMLINLVNMTYEDKKFLLYLFQLSNTENKYVGANFIYFIIHETFPVGVCAKNSITNSTDSIINKPRSEKNLCVESRFLDYVINQIENLTVTNTIYIYNIEVSHNMYYTFELIATIIWYYYYNNKQAFDFDETKVLDQLQKEKKFYDIFEYITRISNKRQDHFNDDLSTGDLEYNLSSGSSTSSLSSDNSTDSDTSTSSSSSSSVVSIPQTKRLRSQKGKSKKQRTLSNSIASAGAYDSIKETNLNNSNDISERVEKIPSYNNSQTSHKQPVGGKKSTLNCVRFNKKVASVINDTDPNINERTQAKTSSVFYFL